MINLKEIFMPRAKKVKADEPVITPEGEVAAPADQCEECKGLGLINNNHNLCPACQGTGKK